MERTFALELRGVLPGVTDLEADLEAASEALMPLERLTLPERVAGAVGRTAPLERAVPFTELRLWSVALPRLYVLPLEREGLVPWRE